MNYFLVLSEINRFFQGVSSLDTKLMASVAACDDNCYNSIFQILSEEIIPDYYENNFRNDTKFGRDEIEYEAKIRGYYYDVIEKTNGEDGNEECEISITISGETFVKVEQGASKSTAYTLVQTAMEGFPRANDIQYTCFSNGTLLLAPYRKTGAILGFVKYSELPRLNDIIRAIATFNDDQVDSLLEGLVLYE